MFFCKFSRNMYMSADIAWSRNFVGRIAFLIIRSLQTFRSWLFVGLINRFWTSFVWVPQPIMLSLIACCFWNLRELWAQIFVMQAFSGCKIILWASQRLGVRMLMWLAPRLWPRVILLLKFTVLYLNVCWATLKLLIHIDAYSTSDFHWWLLNLHTWFLIWTQ